MGISGVSVYSFASSLLFFNIGLLLISRLRRSTAFLVKNSTTALMLLLLLSIIRILLPLDLSSAFVIQSKKILPLLQKILNVSVWNGISIISILGGIWGIGIIMVIISATYNFVVERKKLRSYKTVKSEQVNRVVKETFANQAVVVVISPEVEIPRVTGLVNAYIYIPPLSVTDDELRLILLHEFRHIKGGDIYIKLFYILLKAIFWWNPVVHMFQYEVENMLELRCDMATTKMMSNEVRFAYLETILKVIKQSKIERVNCSVNTATLINANIQGITKQRFEVVLNRMENTKKGIKIVSMILICLAFVCSYFVIMQPVYFPPLEEIAGHIEITTDNAYIIITEDDIIELFVENEPYSIITYKEMETAPYNKLQVINEGGKE